MQRHIWELFCNWGIFQHFLNNNMNHKGQKKILWSIYYY